MRRVGSTREQKVDVRILAATNRSLHEPVDAGNFREDLYYRINVLSIELPPLRKRREDIGLLIDHLLRQAGGENWRVTNGAREALCNYQWPGNIRELSNIIERATILADDQCIRTSDLPEVVAQHTDFADNNSDLEIDNLEERERRHVARVLDRENWNRNATADALGITRRSLYRLIEKYRLVQQRDPPTITEDP